jgi:hypothetical protein
LMINDERFVVCYGFSLFVEGEPIMTTTQKRVHLDATIKNQFFKKSKMGLFTNTEVGYETKTFEVSGHAANFSEFAIVVLENHKRAKK